MASHAVRATVVALALALLLPAASTARRGAASGCALVRPAELHAIFHATVKKAPGETALDCNFLAPKFSDVSLTGDKMSKARFEKFRASEKKLGRQTVTDVSGLGGPAYWVDPDDPKTLGFGLYILHGSYQLQLDVGAAIPQIHRTKQASHDQVLKLAKLIVKRAAK